MEVMRKIAIVLWSGVICAFFGPIVGAAGLILFSELRGGFDASLGVVFSSLAGAIFTGLFLAGPGCFLLGLVGGYWLSCQPPKNRARLPLRGAIAGAILGGFCGFFIPLPFSQLHFPGMSDLLDMLAWTPLGAGAGCVCGRVLAWFYSLRLSQSPSQDAAAPAVKESENK
jgi:hypothetical protein